MYADNPVPSENVAEELIELLGTDPSRKVATFIGNTAVEAVFTQLFGIQSCRATYLASMAALATNYATRAVQ